MKNLVKIILIVSFLMLTLTQAHAHTHTTGLKLNLTGLKTVEMEPESEVVDSNCFLLPIANSKLLVSRLPMDSLEIEEPVQDVEFTPADAKRYKQHIFEISLSRLQPIAEEIEEPLQE